LVVETFRSRRVCKLLRPTLVMPPPEKGEKTRRYPLTEIFPKKTNLKKRAGKYVPWSSLYTNIGVVAASPLKRTEIEGRKDRGAPVWPWKGKKPEKRGGKNPETAG